MEQINKETLEYLVGIGQSIERYKSEYDIIEINGGKFVNMGGSLKKMETTYRPVPDSIETFSLNGLIDLINSDTEKIIESSATPFIVKVDGPSRVIVYAPLVPETQTRPVYAICDATLPRIHFDCYRDAEEMTIELLTNFKEDYNRNLVLQLVGSLKQEQSAETADDGFSQRVTIRKGVASVGETTVKNPVELTPYRTFHEVDQPTSPFVLRISDGGKVALFEADGSQWKIESVRNIANYLRTSLAGTNTSIIA